MKVKSESEVAQLCLTLHDPMDCSLPDSSVHGIFQARIQEWVAIAFCPGQPGVNHCQAAQGVRDGLDLTSFPCVHSTHICCASSKEILCGPHKGLMMRPLMKLFSGGDRIPSSALCAPKDCASVCTRGRNRRGPSSLFIHHPADQTLAPRSGSARQGSEHPAGDPEHRGFQSLIASPGPSCPSPAPSLPAPSPAPAVAQSPRASSTTPVRLLVVRPEPLWGRSRRFVLARRRRPPT